MIKKSTLLFTIFCTFLLIVSAVIYTFYSWENNNEKITYNYIIELVIVDNKTTTIYIPTIIDDNGINVIDKFTIYKNRTECNITNKITAYGQVIEITTNHNVTIKYTSTENFISDGHFYSMTLQNKTKPAEKNSNGTVAVWYWIFLKTNTTVDIALTFDVYKPNHRINVVVESSIIKGWNEMEGELKEAIV